MWCYTCEPKSENTVLADFDIFPEPSNSSTWQAAQKYVAATAGGGAPVYHPEIIPGRQWTDPVTKITNLVPGSDYFLKQNRDPYQDLVYLGKDLGLAGVDIGKLYGAKNKTYYRDTSTFLFPCSVRLLTLVFCGTAVSMYISLSPRLRGDVAR